MSLGLAIALLVVGTATAAEEPRSFGELQRAVGARSASARAVAYRKFAEDTRPAIGDRLRAVQALLQAVPPADRKQINARLLQARLCGVADRGGCRTGALWQAKQAAQKHGDNRLEAISGAIAGDRALDEVARALRKRQKKAATPQLTDKEQAAIAALEEALPFYETLGDRRQYLRAQYLAAAILEFTPTDLDEVMAGLDAIAGMDPAERDLTPLVADYQRTRARILITLDRWQDAAAAALSADHALANPPRKAAFEPQPYPLFGKSRDTMEVCYRARVAAQVDCAQLEQQSFGAISYYDFGRERRMASFDPELGEMAAAEYGPLIQGCIQAAAAGGQVQNTHLEVVWTIGYNGKVKSYELMPTRLRNTDFSRCLDATFKQFRYPSYAGEMQHTALKFEIAE